MATFGAKMPIFAPTTAENAGALPTYGTILTVGKLVKADLTVNSASGELYADDGLAEHMEVFTSGSLSMETDDVTDAVAQVIYGASVSDGVVTYSTSDVPPLGGLAYYKTLVRGSTTAFKGYYYPQVRAALGNDTAETKGDSITFGTASTTWSIMRANDNTWRQTKEFTGSGAEAACIAWIKAKLGET